MIHLLTALILSLLIVFIHPALGLMLSASAMIFAATLPRNSGRQTLFLFLAFFMPLFPEAGVEILGRRLNWFDWVLLGLALRLIVRPLSLETLIRLDAIQKGAILYLGILFLLALQSGRPAISIGEWISHAVNLGLTLFIAEGFSKKADQRMGAALASATIVAALVGLWQKINGYVFAATKDGESTIRVGVPGTFEDSLLLGMFAAASGLLMLRRLRLEPHPAHRVLLCCGLGASVLALRLSLTRTGMFMFAIGIAVMGLLMLSRWLSDRRKAIVIPALLVAIPLFSTLSLSFMPEEVKNRVLSVIALLSRDPDPVLSYSIRSTLGRLENYRHAVRTFSENPATGMGLGLYKHLTRFEDTDGFWPGMLAETGLAGLIPFFFFLYLILKKIFVLLKKASPRMRPSAEVLAGFFFAMLAGALVEPTYKIQCLSFLFFYLLRQTQRDIEGPRIGEEP